MCGKPNFSRLLSCMKKTMEFQLMIYQRVVTMFNDADSAGWFMLMVFSHKEE